MDKKELSEEKIAALSGAGVETTGGRLNLAGADTEDKAVMTDDEAEGDYFLSFRESSRS